MLDEITICVLIGTAVNRIRHNVPYRLRIKGQAGLCPIFLLVQSSGCCIVSPGGKERLKYMLHQSFFFRNRDEIGISILFTAAAMFRPVYRKSCRRNTSHPATIFSKLDQVVGDTLLDDVTFKLCDDAEHLDHHLGVAILGVQIIGTDQQGHIMLVQIVDHSGQIRHLTADTIQLIADNSTDLVLLHIADHSLKIGPIGIETALAFVLVYLKFIISRELQMQPGIFPAVLLLVGNGVAFVGDL